MSLWAMFWKELIQLWRDRLTLGLLLLIPAFDLTLFGYAIRTEVRHLPTVVLDESRTVESRTLIDVMHNTGNFDMIGQVESRQQLQDAIEAGRANAALVIPPSFTRDLKHGRTAEAQVIVDAADPLASSAALSGAALAGFARSAELTRARGGGPSPVEIRVRPWYNPDLRSAVHIVPGIIGVILSMTMVSITSAALVRERERGTLEQLIVTPIDKASLVFGKILPFMFIGYAQITVVLLLGRLLFGIPFRGSLTLLLAMSLVFIIASLALGLFVSTLVSNQVQAMQLSFLILLPNILLSGFMFPRQSMPQPAQWVGALLPLTYYLNIIRGILLKGVGLRHLWVDGLVLTGFAAAFVTVSVRRFHKTVE